MKKTLLLISVLTAVGAQAFTVDWGSIKHWSGSGPNEAAVVVQFDDGKSTDAYIWGYRFADGETPTCETMLRDVVGASSDLVLLTQYTSQTLGNTVDGFGMSDGCTAVLQNLKYDFAAASEDKNISFGYYTPNTAMGQTSAPGDEAATLCAAAISAAATTHIIEHPLDARGYGYPAYDYDHWQLGDASASDVRWNAGWYSGYWSYWVGGSSSDDLGYSNFGITTAEVSNHSVHAFKYTSLDGDFDGTTGASEQWGKLNYHHYLAPDPTSDITLEGVSGTTIEIAPMGAFILKPVYTPDDAAERTCQVTLSDISADGVLEYISYYNAIVAHHFTGSAKLTLTSDDGNVTKTFDVVIKDYDREVPADDYQSGVFWLNEEWYSHTAGSLNYVGADRSILCRAYEAQNEGRAFGQTSQFATVWADKLIVMSKVASEPGDIRQIENNGGCLVIADAKTLRRIASFDEIGGEAHACAGVSPKKVYLTHASGVRVLDLENMALAASDIEGLSGDVGDIVVAGRYAFAVVGSTGIAVIDTADDSFVKTIADADVQGVVVTADGNVWYASTTSDDVTTLHCIDPLTLEEERQVTLPAKVAGNSWAYAHVSLFANPNANEICWSPYGAWSGTGNFYRWNIDETDDPSELEAVFTYTGSAQYGDPYGTAGYDARTDEFMFATCVNYGGTHFLHFVDASTGEVNKIVELPYYWWYPAMPVLPDQYSPELDIDDQVFEFGDTDARDFNVAELVSDRDDIDAFITYSLSPSATEQEQAATFALSDDGVLTVTPVAPGEASATIELTSRGRVVEHTLAVTVKDDSGVSDIATDATVTANGSLLIFRGFDGAGFTVYNLSGVAVRSYDIAGGVAVIDTALPAGTYVAVSGAGESYKFIIK